MKVQYLLPPSVNFAIDPRPTFKDMLPIESIDIEPSNPLKPLNVKHPPSKEGVSNKTSPIVDLNDLGPKIRANS